MAEANYLVSIPTWLIGAITCLLAGYSPAISPEAGAQTWHEMLPKDVRESVVWSADHEEGTLFDWEYKRNPDNNGGGIFNTGGQEDAIAKAILAKPFTGKFCAEATINNAFQSRNGNRGVRLMRWTDKPWDRGGKFFPDSAYYGIWMRIDHQYSVRNDASPSGGWWNVFQFKSNDENGDSQPVWVLNVGTGRQNGKMHFYLHSEHNVPASISQPNPIPIPVGRWFHVEAFYHQSNSGNGTVTVWQDGQMILNGVEVKTILSDELIWGVGNYTDHIAGGIKPGSATVYFDDATVSTEPTHKYVQKLLRLRQ